MSTTNKILYGLFGDDDDLMIAIKKLRENGFDIGEVYTPFPVHGLDKALGLKKTRISDAAFFYGLYGFILASTLTWFVMVRDWPQNIGGKPSFTWGENMPAFVPVMFELTVFCAAHLMSITYLIRCKLYPGANASNPDPRTTDDKFIIEMNSGDFDSIINIFKDSNVEEITIKEEQKNNNELITEEIRS